MSASIHSPLRIEAWPDPVIDALGHLPTSEYFEWLYVPRLGPTSSWAYRRLVQGLSTRPEGYAIELEVLAAWLGLGAATGPHATVVRSLGRLVRFGVALQVDEATLRLRRHVAPLAEAHLQRLHPTLRQVHVRLANTTVRSA